MAWVSGWRVTHDCPDDIRDLPAACGCSRGSDCRGLFRGGPGPSHRRQGKCRISRPDTFLRQHLSNEGPQEPARQHMPPGDRRGRRGRVDLPARHILWRRQVPRTDRVVPRRARRTGTCRVSGSLSIPRFCRGAVCASPPSTARTPIRPMAAGWKTVFSPTPPGARSFARLPAGTDMSGCARATRAASRRAPRPCASRLSRSGIKLGWNADSMKRGYALTEDLALTLGLLFRALAPMRSRENMRAVAEGIEAWAARRPRTGSAWRCTAIIRAGC